MSSVPATEPTAHNPFVGKVMGGRYQVDRLIGRGGMGLVYLGREVLNDRQLVLKMLAPQWADDEHAVARFEREGKRLAQLRHPNIVELFDIGHQDGQTYIVMEFIRGIPLRRVLSERRRLTLDEFFPIASQLLQAVAYAHKEGVMLRDIKPSNVMLCEADGKANVVKVLDFGLAKMVEGDDVDVTKTNVIGTAGFLAPEQIRGEDADVRVDVYSLSIMFFIMLTGVSPILGENDGAILYNHVHGTPKPFAEVLPAGEVMPDALEALIYRCMEKDPAKRPSNAGEMWALLLACAEEEAFDLPETTATGTAEIDTYWDAKISGSTQNVSEPTSSLWTRPRLQELLANEEAERDAAIALAKAQVEDDAPIAELALSDAEVELEAPGPGVPRRMPPQPSAAIRARTSSSPNVREAKAEGTRVGLPVVRADGTAETDAPAPRRPKPAKTPASSNMERVVARPAPARRRGPPPPPPPPGGVRKDPQDTGPNPNRTLVPGINRAPVPPTGTKTLVPGVAATPGKPTSTRTLVPKPKPRDSEGPADADDPVGPLYMELAAPPRKRRRAAPGPAVIPLVDRGAPTDEAPTPALEDKDTQDNAPAFDPASLSEEIPETAVSAARATAAKLTTAAPPPASESNSRVGLILVAAVAVAVLLGGFVFWLALGRDPATPAVAATGAQDPPKKPKAKSKATPSAPEVAVAAKAAEPVPTPAVTVATVTVRGPEGAEVFIDDSSVGELPLDTELAEGEHSVRVEASGFQTWESTIEVEAGVALEVEAEPEVERSGSPRSGRRPKRGRDARPADPTPAEPTPTPTPEPKDAAPAAPKDAPPAPEPPKSTPKKNDDVFMDDKKDGGIFLPVGKDK